VVEHITVELLVLEALVVEAVVEQVVLTITELLELPILEAAVAVVLFKPTHLIGLAVQAVLVWSFCLFRQQITQAQLREALQLPHQAQTQF
jgi:hypothetical protein